MSEVEGGRILRTYEAEAAAAIGIGLIPGTAANQVKLPTAANQFITGIAHTKGDPADPKYLQMTVAQQGQVLVLSAAAFSIGDLLKVAGTTGKLGPIGDEVGGNVRAVARAIEAAGGANELVAANIEQFELRDQMIAAWLIAGTAAATAADYGAIFQADHAMELIEFVERHEVAGSDADAVTLMLAKVPSGTAKAAGTDMLAAGLNLKAVADTNQVATLHATAGNRQLADGDAIALVPTGTLTAVAGLLVRATFRLID